MGAVTIRQITDQQIEKAWSDWERPGNVREFLMDWIAMSHAEKMAFFYGMIMPRVFGGRAARNVTMQRIWDLGLVSRYPTRPDGQP